MESFQVLFSCPLFCFSLLCLPLTLITPTLPSPPPLHLPDVFHSADLKLHAEKLIEVKILILGCQKLLKFMRQWHHHRVSRTSPQYQWRREKARLPVISKTILIGRIGRWLSAVLQIKDSPYNSISCSDCCEDLNDRVEETKLSTKKKDESWLDC